MISAKTASASSSKPVWVPSQREYGSGQAAMVRHAAPSRHAGRTSAPTGLRGPAESRCGTAPRRHRRHRRTTLRQRTPPGSSGPPTRGADRASKRVPARRHGEVRRSVDDACARARRADRGSIGVAAPAGHRDRPLDVCSTATLRSATAARSGRRRGRRRRRRSTPSRAEATPSAADRARGHGLRSRSTADAGRRDRSLGSWRPARVAQPRPR